MPALDERWREMNARLDDRLRHLNGGIDAFHGTMRRGVMIIVALSGAGLLGTPVILVILLTQPGSRSVCDA